MTRSSFKISVPAAPLRQQVVERLRAAIAECHFQPGGRLIERELCELMGVSRSSLREALRQLEAEGLVTSIANKGVVVAQLSLEEAEQAYRARAALEGLVGRMFTESARDEEVEALDRTVKAMETAFETQDWNALHRAKTDFYKVLLKGARNEIITGWFTQLRARFALLRGESLSQESRRRESIQEQRRVVEAIKARDAEAAAELCVAHIEASAKAALALLKKDPEAPVEAAS